MLRKHIATILRARAPALSAEAAREMAIVVLELMKAARTLGNEEGLPGRAAGCVTFKRSRCSTWSSACSVTG